jgi:hypothetical protein
VVIKNSDSNIRNESEVKIMSKRTTISILQDVDNTLETAKFGLHDFLNGSPERKMSGLRNLFVFGRAVTNVLQNLRSTEKSFEEWYTPYQDEMKNNVLLKYIYNLRTEILKKGLMKTSISLNIHSFSSGDIARFREPPVGAVAFFMGDQIGGTGWEVQLPDGSREKYYVELPVDIGSTSTHFPDLVESIHLPPEVDGTVESISSFYYNYLDNMVEDAKKYFASKVH